MGSQPLAPPLHSTGSASIFCTYDLAESAHDLGESSPSLSREREREEGREGGREGWREGGREGDFWWHTTVMSWLLELYSV